VVVDAIGNNIGAIHDLLLIHCQMMVLHGEKHGTDSGGVANGHQMFLRDAVADDNVRAGSLERYRELESINS